MKYSCDVIKDLLPLYYDKACSEQSKKIVEEHLAECASCRSMMTKLQNNTYENCLHDEKNEIIKNYTRSVKKKALFAGFIVVAVTLLTCFIANLATGNTLDWFFIVLTSLIVFASLTAVPMMAEKKKGLWTLGSFAVSLFLLLMTCCLYSGGNWLLVATAAVLFGLSVVFLPFVIGQVPLKGFAVRNKGLLVMAVDTILFYLLIISCGLYSKNAGYWQPALLISTVGTLIAWALFAVIRYLKANGFIRAGICVIVVGAATAFANDIISLILDGTRHLNLFQANLTLWTTDTLINANVCLLVLLSSIVIGVLLLLAGFLRRGKSAR